MELPQPWLCHPQRTLVATIIYLQLRRAINVLYSSAGKGQDKLQWDPMISPEAHAHAAKRPLPPRAFASYSLAPQNGPKLLISLIELIYRWHPICVLGLPNHLFLPAVVLMAFAKL